MKKTKKIGIIALLIVACGLFVASGIGFANLNKASAATIENIYVLDQYDLGKVFTIPKAKINVDGNIVDSEYAYLVFPSGKATDKSPVTLTEEGTYTLVYTATVEGKKVKATKKFAVTKQIYKLNDKNSSVYYGSHPDLPSVEGAVLTLVNGDEFVYDEIIDLSDNYFDDALLKMIMPTTVKGKADVSEVVVRFTDIYNENNYFEIRIKNVADAGDWALSQSYIVAGATNQTHGGWENAPGNKTFHVNNYFGFPVRFSMSGIPANATKGYDLLTLSYDVDENAVYADNQIYAGSNMIADFDDNATFLNLWKGFTTGEARMSIRGADYKSEKMYLVITEIDGGEPKKAITTDVAPIITIPMAEKGELPYALVGKDYKIFDANAFDTHEGVKDYTVNVYYNYGKENQVSYNVVDGKFNPNKAGIYTIVYTAVDGSNQKTEVRLDVEAFAHDGFSVDVLGKTEKGYTGKKVSLFDDVLCENVSGEVSYIVTVNGEEIEKYQGEYLFTPLKDGVYTVGITVSDYVKEETVEFTVTALRNYTPQISDEIILPKYMIQGEKVTLPKVDGYSFATGDMKRYDTQIFVKENGGEEKEIVGREYTPSVTGTVEFIYRVTVDGRKSEQKKTVNVVSVFEDESLRMERYFHPVSGNPELAAEDAYVTISASEKSSVEFINSLQVKDFYMTFVVNENFNALKKINIYFTDIEDSSKQIKFTYSKKVNGAATFAINDGEAFLTDLSFKDSSKNFMLTYSNGVAYGSQTVYSTVTKYLDGRDFAGFSNDMAYVTIELDEVSDKSVVCVKNINRQSINNSNKDRVAPQILTDAIVGERTVGDVISINGALAADVLTNGWDFTLKVTDPNGNFVTAKDGTLLNGENNDPNAKYEIEISVYGDYQIEYYAKDRFGKDKTLSYFITVRDSIPPVVVLGSAKKTAKVGETVTVASVTATDNISENVTIFVVVENPDYQCILVSNNKFVATEAGVYTVRYMVWDEAGNYSFVSYTITVK